ncbi:hypothetical protein LIER_01313 [Lithospermum erythrorhizon]|uniref:Trafficking protein particle complex II-specific subunit 130 homolog n=1 Tax=Lithospermum erythrorhizon TaxID=34254 RepID=A0AAV3NKE5_LITER
MANFLAQLQNIKASCDRIVIAVEDVSDLWPQVKTSFEERLPFKRALLNNKTRNAVLVDELPADFILTTDARLRSRFPHEQSLFWFREPYATVVLVSCEDLDEFKTILKPRLKLIVQNDEREWFIVFVSKAPPHSDQATKMAKKVYAKLEVEFSSKKRERCCKLDLEGSDANFWEDLESKIMECVRNTLDKRIQFYEDEIRKLSEQRFMPIWSFCNFFILKESLAFMFEIAYLHEDALREYDELELCYSEAVNMAGKKRTFGGTDHGDDQAALLNPGKKPLLQIVQDDSFREFEFRQYLFACQAKLLFSLNRSYEVASRGHSFIISFSMLLADHERILPFCTREVWVLTACLQLISATASHHKEGQVATDIENEFYRVLGDLYSLSRTKFMRLAYLIGYVSEIERSAVNSASLSMLPWPKPAVWPLLPSDASAEALVKEKMILQETPQVKHFGIQRKPLPLEPSLLLREANRRRASLSVGNALELIDGRSIEVDSSLSSETMTPTVSMSRTNSSPGNFESSIGRPMTLAEIFVAAEHALRNLISDEDIRSSLSSLKEFEDKYLELTKGAADNYHRSWWKRHGVVLDGEIAAVYHKHKSYDLAAKLYEKVCALYSGEGWQNLLAEVLPNLAECQKVLDDQPGYLSSCVRLLSLEKSLFSTKERQAFQAEVVRLAHGEMKHPVPLDVSSLITFSGNPGPPVQLCDGDPGTLSVIVWSGFPDDITLETLNLTLSATNSADEGAKGIKSSNATILKPGKNTVSLSLPPQKPGSYVLGALTGQIGQLKFRSHSFSKGAPADSDDFMSYEKPTRPILKVFKPRPLVDLSAAISSALLMNEPQWVGIIVKPINYPLKGAVLHVDTGPGLGIELSHPIEIERYKLGIDDSRSMSSQEDSTSSGSSVHEENRELTIQDKKITFPDWASNITTVMWIPVRATSDTLARGTPAGSTSAQGQSMVEGLRTIALKLEFGVSHNQTFESTLAVHFTDPFHVSMRVADKCHGDTLLLQVMLQSQVKASLTIHDAWLDLQCGFAHIGESNGRPLSEFFPLMVSPKSTAAMLFYICLESITSKEEADGLRAESVLNIRYSICGDRNVGAHNPIAEKANGRDDAEYLTFRSALALQRPVLDPFLAVGFLPLPSTGLQVGQLVTMQWRVERLKDLEDGTDLENKDELLYEVNANTENWMIAGRKRGHIALSTKQGSRIVITIKCLPLVAGYVRPPQLRLPNVDEANISCNLPGPHLICISPPALSSSYCIPA